MIKNWKNWEPNWQEISMNQTTLTNVYSSLGPTSASSSSGSLSGSGHIRTVKSFAYTQCWLTTPEYLSACGRCSIKDQKVPQHVESRGFAVKASQCSSHLYRSNHEYRLSDPTNWSSTQCWLTTPEILSACGRCSIKDQKVHQHLQKPVSPWRQIDALAIYTESNHE